MLDLLKLLEENARYTVPELAAMLGTSESEVKAALAACEKSGVIRGYKAIIDWDRTERDYVSARIELKVTPKRDRGFEELAEQIARFPEVQSVYLMSGGYDLALTIVGENFKDIASFVAYRLAPMDSVLSTATHFVLRRYKDRGAMLVEPGRDERSVML
ncbi:MAG: Lrp/AsnC family transcriptional regulator [Oscillospiraceae bacterium]|jgi:DNA-binding Lrp family transcriptional regulator|nr:Lrp/AsnC family transcriptional regulator [Oscillospiraceae bacterium]